MKTKKDRILRRKEKKKRKSKFDFINSSKYELLDYNKHEILMYGGIRKNSTKKREPETVKWIEECMRPGDIMYDVGANVGAYSLVAGANGISVYAFEPSVITYIILLKNIMKNKLEAKIVPLNIPLSDRHELSNFNYVDMIAGGSTHTFGEAINFRGEKFKPVLRQLMMSTTINDLVFKYGLPCVNHLKLDVDGNEIDILKGADKVMLLGTLKTICVEVIDDIADKEKMDNLICRFGFVEEKESRTRVNKIYKLTQ